MYVIVYGIIAKIPIRRHHHTSIYFRVLMNIILFSYLNFNNFIIFIIIIRSLLLQKIYVRCFTAHVMTKVIAIILSESDRIC